MEKTALLFPGQGSQYIGMGKSFYEKFDAVKKIFLKSSDILGFNIKEIMFDGPEEVLTQTKNTQPALFIHSYSVYSILREEGIEPDYTAGHSLGEYTAVAVSGGLSFEDALSLVKLRGELMQTAGEKSPGTMAAVIGLDNDTVKGICDEISRNDVVIPANYNCPGQLVISGTENGVVKAMDMAKSKGAKIVRRLPVSGAFHSPLMETALEKLSQKIENTEFKKTDLPIISNYTGSEMHNPDEIKINLKKQLLNPVLWEKSMNYLIERNVERFIETGAGRVLQGLMKRISKKKNILGIDKVEDLEKIKR